LVIKARYNRTFQEFGKFMHSVTVMKLVLCYCF